MGEAMDLIVEMRTGSHLHGTATAQSDLDLKAVYLPDATDILLQRVRPSVSAARAKQRGERNRPDDVDREAYSLHRYLALLAEGQSIAIDMLFAPDWAMTMPAAPLWREIQAESGRLVSRRASSFLRYCRQQANKYGIKGSRVAAARQALALLAAAEARHGTTAPLETIAADLAELARLEHVALVDRPMPGGAAIRHLELCGRQVSFRASLKTAREIAERLVEAYGQRALQAERDEGVDWKALAHAVRVGHSALELLASGRLAFPLATAPRLRAIRAAAVPYAEVAAEIERLLGEVEAAAAASPLPAAPDQGLIEALVRQAYREQVLQDRP
jgi:hypothetical protein